MLPIFPLSKSFKLVMKAVTFVSLRIPSLQTLLKNQLHLDLCFPDFLSKFPKKCFQNNCYFIFCLKKKKFCSFALLHAI